MKQTPHLASEQTLPLDLQPDAGHAPVNVPAPQSAGEQGFPFAALLGYPNLRQALLLAAVDPGMGGVLISEYGTGTVSSYEIDLNGDPVPGTRRAFMTGLGGAEGGTRDPVSGDFLFSTFGGGSRVVVVRGFTPDCEVRANVNRDCALNFFDVQLFLQLFAAGDDLADFTDDDVFNFFDVQTFLSQFSQGC